jgi:two-component system, NtrC family, sensor kinase
MGVLEEKADLLELLFEATNDGVVDWDIGGNQVHYNERWRYQLGWDEEGFDLTTTTWRDLIHPDERREVERALVEHLERDWPFLQTVRMQHRSLGWRWIQMRGKARRNDQGEPVRMAIICADVDERVRAEAQVRALVEAIPDIIVRVRSDGTVIAIKEGNRLAYAAEQSEGVPHGLLDAIQASEACARVKESIRTAGQRKDVAQVPCRLKNPAGDLADYDIRVVCSGPDEAICIVRDVTREKSAEEQLARGKRLEAIGQLAAGLAHEINTPLQYIGDNLQFAKDAVPPLLALVDDYRSVVRAGEPASTDVLTTLGKKEESVDLPFLRESLARILGNGLDGLAQIARIVRAMKTFEHVGRQERADAELNAIVENATVVVTHSWSQVAEVSMRLATDLPLVPCVVGEIAQVIMNLVINAAETIADKVGKSGSKGLIIVETLPHPASESVEIRVTDNGVGIPEAIRGKVFDPFFTTRPVGLGSGQGLAQVHFAVVRLHGGTVHFDSREGEGTCFVVRLPVRVARAQELPASAI